MELTFDVIGLVVADMPASLAFYRRLGLGLPAEADRAPHVEYTLPGGIRLCWDTEEVMGSFDPSFARVPAGRASLGFLAASPSEVDRAYEDMVAAGFHGHLPPWDAVWGQRYAVLHDPDGATVDLFCPLPT